MRHIALCLMIVGLPMRMVCGGETEGDTPVRLQFRDNGTFRIVQFADIHWSLGFDKDHMSLDLMGAVLDAEKPDLVVYTGDNLSGGCLLPQKGLERLASPAIERGIPWALVFGNHDDEGPVSREKQMEVVQALPHCLSVPGPEDVDGVGNFVLPVHASKDADNIAALLYFFDSLAYRQHEGEKVYDYIQPAQVRWYKEMSRGYTEAHGGKPLPALAFFHIPLPEYNDVWEAGKCIGVKQEDVCCSPINSGLFTAMKEQGDVVGVFVGHDHVNDYIGKLDGIYLGYGRGTGFTAYGTEGFPRGARVVELREGERRFTTWHRLEDGKVEWQLR